MAFAESILRCLLFFGLQWSATSEPMIPSVADYFPDLRRDLTRIEWQHAVNTKCWLTYALDDKEVHMLEADVVLGFLEDGAGPIPIMAHPPANISDLSLQYFIQAVIDVQKSKKKGIKLDFKSDEAYNASWPILNELRAKLTFPVWLNADILIGPGNSSTIPLDWNKFISLAREQLPDAPLSLGWTTAYEEGATYSTSMLKEMEDVIKEGLVVQPVTLAVRAAFAALCEKGITDLVSAIDKLQGSNKTTLTVWMSTSTDVVNITKLRSLLASMGKTRIALDVPDGIRRKLLASGAPAVTATGAVAVVLALFTAVFSMGAIVI